jgi:branched-subunit amino acid transport protein
VSDEFILIAGCTVVTIAMKAAGPVALGGRDLPPAFLRVIALLGPALFAALVVTDVLADGKQLGVGDQAIGVAAGGIVAWRTGSIIGCIAVAAALTAALRALT